MWGIIMLCVSNNRGGGGGEGGADSLDAAEILTWGQKRLIQRLDLDKRFVREGNKCMLHICEALSFAPAESCASGLECRNLVPVEDLTRRH